MNYKVSHPIKIVNCEIDLPSSKSISNRLLIIRALCKDNFEIANLSNSNDTKNLLQALNSSQKTIDVNHAGTSFRFLTSFLTLQYNKEFILTGSDRLKERPIKDLVEVLQKMGAQIEYLDKEGFAPLKILGAQLSGRVIEIDGEISSQFISSILLISPTLNNGIEPKINGDLVSKPYILMTLKLMSEFGIQWTWTGNIIIIRKQKYIAKNYTVESDWSAASFWFQIASLSEKCDIRLKGLQYNSIQADEKVMEIFKGLGVVSVFKNGILILTKNKGNTFPKKINLIETPDLYQALKCTLFAKNIIVEFLGLQTLKNKETDRVTAVNTELEKLTSTKIIATYEDHRMAMSFAPLSLKFGGLQINNPEVVNKSYPNFWNDLTKGGFIISPLSE
ncbi:MAG: 3-phosphoshikimate 1-carboxyvinyltransferase [Bacteroidota bacterium]|nr:3-phosphoshikimate 1-carboxyvinyltransferase [Bacteroidota bacterium]